ncbi:hypothetical protein ANCDUO_12055 [Ancylostoma duodenale]|uniref:Uncharacterized protein n=1 Tax=Ancylostoma duodenale TaxID=51022 RepID=A0A0C2G9V1_9BILA|nr:hypothetical protein ANCDUO_12055 [Ancylostoma duodenale]
MALSLIEGFGLECRRVGELLCRHCGASVTRQSELINAATSEHLYKYKYQFPIVGENATIYVFENPSAFFRGNMVRWNAMDTVCLQLLRAAPWMTFCANGRLDTNHC